MSNTDDPISTTLPRRELGRALRDAREGAGYTLEHAAALMEMGKASLGRLERGELEKVKTLYLEALCKLYGIEDRSDELKAIASDFGSKLWWHSTRNLLDPVFRTYIGLEAGAEKLSILQSLVVPGLLQVAAYIRAIEQPYFDSDTAEDVDRRVKVRQRRSAILTRSQQPVQLDVILTEAVLRTVVGSKKTMSLQMRHLADTSTRDNVRIRILPFSTGFPVKAIPTPYTIMNFPQKGSRPGEPSVVYAENIIGSIFYQDDKDVLRFREIYDDIWNVALDEGKSREMLRHAARRCEQ
ncbi:helix-turn-helix domain-containing protein [Nocardia macrotermitis]|uniref:helix-turn-helix domain-containing protein n=1 Tax=Nocardia macrotermitis TaxID=2585198 RepID=UPI00188633B8|nr:helix-turn-helix transcriptional regulator [Nocardia macrotermitis]